MYRRNNEIRHIMRIVVPIPRYIINIIPFQPWFVFCAITDKITIKS